MSGTSIIAQISMSLNDISIFSGSWQVLQKVIHFGRNKRQEGVWNGSASRNSLHYEK